MIEKHKCPVHTTMDYMKQVRGNTYYCWICKEYWNMEGIIADVPGTDNHDQRERV